MSLALYLLFHIVVSSQKVPMLRLNEDPMDGTNGKTVVFSCLIQVRVTVMVILCTHLMYSNDSDMMQWFSNENVSFEVKLRIISWFGLYPDGKCCH